MKPSDVLKSITNPAGSENLVNYWSENLSDIQRWETANAMLNKPPTGLRSDGRGVVMFEGGSNITCPIMCSPLAQEYTIATGQSASEIELLVCLNPREFGSILLGVLYSIRNERNTFEGMACSLTWSSPESPLREYLSQNTSYLFSQPLWLIEVFRDNCPKSIYNIALVLHGWVAAVLRERSPILYQCIESGLDCTEKQVAFYNACTAMFKKFGSFHRVVGRDKDIIDTEPNTSHVSSPRYHTKAKVYDLTIAVLYVILDKSTPPKKGASINWAVFRQVIPNKIADMAIELAQSHAKPISILRRDDHQAI